MTNAGILRRQQQLQLRLSLSTHHPPLKQSAGRWRNSVGPRKSFVLDLSAMAYIAPGASPKTAASTGGAPHRTSKQCLKNVMLPTEERRWRHRHHADPTGPRLSPGDTTNQARGRCRHTSVAPPRRKMTPSGAIGTGSCCAGLSSVSSHTSAQALRSSSMSSHDAAAATPCC